MISIKQAIAATAILFACTSNAALITQASDLGGSTQTVDFSAYAGNVNLSLGNTFTLNSSQGEQVTWESNSGFSVLGDSFGAYSFGDNGNWTNSARQGYVGLAAQSGTMTFSFLNGPVNGVGGFINYFKTANAKVSAPTAPTLRVYDITGNSLEAYFLDGSAAISTNGSNDSGAFRGIQRQTNDIYSFSISDFSVALDDLSFARLVNNPPVNNVNQPTIIAIFLLGMLALTYRKVSSLK